MALSEITLTGVNRGEDFKIPKMHGKSENIAVSSNSFVDEHYIDMADLQKLLIQIQNKHASNSLDYAIYGFAEELAMPPAYNAERYHELKASTTIAADSQDSVSVTDNWRWILIRLKRTTTDQDSTASIFVRGKK
ncbi:MAG: hypothetical protein K5785_00955 [Nitrosarchaeum sp.]|nr:hypothetical protein [Nitrosarchaeum sp.]